MARGVNKVILVGNLGADPEMRYTNNGSAVANFSVATSESWKDKNSGEQQERTEWHRCVAWGRTGEIIGEYLRKGSKVYLEGSLQTRKWEDSAGVERYTTEIVVRDMQMLDSRNTGDNQARPQTQPSGTGGNQFGKPQQQAPRQTDFDDDIPF